MTHQTILWTGRHRLSGVRIELVTSPRDDKKVDVALTVFHPPAPTVLTGAADIDRLQEVIAVLDEVAEKYDVAPENAGQDNPGATNDDRVNL